MAKKAARKAAHNGAATPAGPAGPAASSTESATPAASATLAAKKPRAGRIARPPVGSTNSDVDPNAGDSSDSSIPVSRFQAFTIKRIHRSKIKGAPYNPRIIDKGSAKRLREGIERHGLVEPVVWNDRNGILIGGHQRLKQLDELEGGTDYYLDVSVLNVDDMSERQINVLLNNEVVSGQWNLDALEELLGAPGFDISGTGFKRSDLGALMDEGVLDSIFGSEGVAQAAAETPVIAELTEIRQSGRDADNTESRREAELERMRAGRKEYRERAKDANSSEFMIVLFADNEAEVDAFLRANDLSLSERYVPLSAIAERMGINLEPISAAVPTT